MSSRYDVFVSYAEADRSWVEGFLLAAFDEANVRYQHERNFTLGAPRLDEMQRAVRESGYTLLVLSPAYFADGSNAFIDLLAQTYGLETATWPVIPLKLRQVDLPPRLAILQGLDWTDTAERTRQIEQLCRELGHPPLPPPPPPACPYVGMAPLSEEDRDRFFGRDQELQELRQRLRLHPFLAVIGPSGSGKSSLVHAGLIPSLRQHGLFGSGPWVTRTLRPGPAPLTALAAALDGEPDRPVSAIRELLSQHGEKAQLLLIVDQFEELFTVTEAGAERFQELLLSLTELPRCRVVVTARADFYPQLMASPLWPLIQAHRMEVLPLDGDALRQAIMRPAENVHVFVETALVERLVADAAGEPGVLPLIQETLVLLWERLEWRLLPLSAYESLVMMPRDAYGRSPGRTGLQVALARRADATMAELTPTQQATARRVLLRLVQFGEGRDDVRRQQPIASLRSSSDQPGDFERTLDHLTKRRLLTATGQERDGATMIDLSHEALITGWPDFQAWIGERRAAEETRRRLEAKAAEWVRLGRGTGGLLDEVELLEAERWLASLDAAEVGFDASLPELAEASRSAIEHDRREREAAQQRELTQARELAAEQQRRAEVQARSARSLRRLLGVLGLVLLLTIGAAGLAVLAQRRADERARFANSRALANRARILAGPQLVTGLLLALEADRLQPTVEARSSLLAALERNPRVTAFLHGHTSSVAAIAVDPDGRMLATGSADNTVRRWDLGRGTPIEPPLTGPTKPVGTVAFSPDGGTIAAGSVDGLVWRWDARSGQPIGAPLPGRVDRVRTVAFSPDGRTLAWAGEDGRIVLWDVGTGQVARTLDSDGKPVYSFAFSPDGRTLASGGDDKTIQLWDPRTGRRLGAPLRGHRERIRAVAFSPDGRILASGGDDRTVMLWDARTRKPIGGPLAGHRQRVFGLAFSPDGRILASAGRDHVILLWDPRTGRRLGAPLTGHTESVRGVVFGKDGTLASVSNDHTVILWDLDRRERLGTRVAGEAGPLNAVAISPDNHLLVAGADDFTIRRWDARTYAPIGPPLRGHRYEVTSVAFSPPDGQTIASGGWEGRVLLWDAKTGRLRATLPGHYPHAVFAVAFTPDGKILASGGADGTVRLWDARSGQPLGAPLRGHTDRVLSLAFDPHDSNKLASGGWDRRIWLWDLGDPQRRGEQLTAPTSPVYALAFGPGNRLLAGTADGAVASWDLTKGRQQSVPAAQLGGHTDEVHAIALSPDGRTLASGGADGSVILWDLATSQQLGDPIAAHSEGVRSLAFSGDGRTLASAGADGDVVVWDVDFRSWQARACRIANRSLYRQEWELVELPAQHDPACAERSAGTGAPG
jgi:WD40 repeat protein